MLKEDGAEDEIYPTAQSVAVFELMRAEHTGCLGLQFPKKPVFKTGAVIRAWLPRLIFATVGNAF